MPSDPTRPGGPRYTRAQRRLLTALAGLIVAALAGGAYALTYDALRELALAGRVGTRWAPLYPAMADTLTAMTILSLVITRNARWWTRLLRWALLLLLVAGGAALSVQHSVWGFASLPEDAVRAGVAVAPHVMLVIAVWLWLTMFKQIRVARPAAEETAPAETQRGHVKVLEPAAPEPPPLAETDPAQESPFAFLDDPEPEPLIPFSEPTPQPPAAEPPHTTPEPATHQPNPTETTAQDPLEPEPAKEEPATQELQARATQGRATDRSDSTETTPQDPAEPGSAEEGPAAHEPPTRAAQGSATYQPNPTEAVAQDLVELEPADEEPAAHEPPTRAGQGHATYQSDATETAPQDLVELERAEEQPGTQGRVTAESEPSAGKPASAPAAYGEFVVEGSLSSEPAPPLDALPEPRPPLDPLPEPVVLPPALLPTDVELVRSKRADAQEKRPLASTTRPDIVMPVTDEEEHDTPPSDRAEDPDAGEHLGRGSDEQAGDWNPPPSGSFRSGPTPPAD